MTKLYNMRKISSGYYLVRTQAGFKKAIKSYNPDLHQSTSWGFDYPKSYPSVVSFGERYAGGWYLTVKVYPLEDFRNNLNKILGELEGE